MKHGVSPGPKKFKYVIKRDRGRMCLKFKYIFIQHCNNLLLSNSKDPTVISKHVSVDDDGVALNHIWTVNLKRYF